MVMAVKLRGVDCEFVGLLDENETGDDVKKRKKKRKDYRIVRLFFDSRSRRSYLLR